MRAPPLPLEDTQDFAFFTLLVKALTTPPRTSDAPRARAAAVPMIEPRRPRPRAWLAAWQGLRPRQDDGARAAPRAPAVAARNDAGQRAAPHPYY